MVRYLKIIIIATKSALRATANGLLHGRYFENVEFRNKNNITVNKNSIIEKGSRLWVTDPTENGINIYIDEECWIGRDVEIQTYFDSKIVIKKNVSVQDRCKILGSVYIGQDSLLAPDVFLSSGNHYYNYQPELLIKTQDKLSVGSEQSFKSKNSPIVIEEDCWLGKNSIVMKGVNVGRGAIIGANSFININVPPYEVWAGAPAKFIKKRLDFNPPLEIRSDKTECRPYFYRGFDHNGDGSEGFTSSNSSVCVLNSSDNIFLFLSGKIHYEGVLKIWKNACLIFNDRIIPGSFNETLDVKQIHPDKNIQNVYQSLPNNIKQFVCVVFEFKPNAQNNLKGFSIDKIKLHD